MSTIFVFPLALFALNSLVPALGNNAVRASPGGCAESFGCVVSTLLISNNTLYQGNLPVRPRFYAGLVNWTFVPHDLVVSPVNGNVYVSEWKTPNKSSYQLKVINPVSNKVTSDLNSSAGSTFGGPYEIAYSKDSSMVYLVAHNTLLGVNTSSGAVRVTSPRPYYTFVPLLTYDTDNGKLFIRTGALNNYSIFIQSVNDSTGALISGPLLLSKNTSEDPIAMTYGEGRNQLYMVTVAHSGPKVVGGAMYVFNTTSQTVVGRVPLEGTPTGVIQDPRNGNLYVTNLNASVGVTVVDPTRLTIVARITGVLSLGGIANDKSDGLLYMVAGGGSADTGTIQNITVINDLTNSFIGNITVGYGASDIAYDPSNQLLYVTNLYSGTLSVIYSPGVTSTRSTTLTASSLSSSSRVSSQSSSTTESPATLPPTTAEIVVVGVAIIGVFGLIVLRMWKASCYKRL